MKSIFYYVFGYNASSPPWRDSAPIREELFGVERLEQHAQSLALAQPVTLDPPPVFSLQMRLNDNARVLLDAYRASAAKVAAGISVVPAAEWLLDNYHLIEEQIREIRDDLPPGYYRQLPKLAEGPFAGYPRVFGIAWAFVAHTDSHFDGEILRRFIAAYQRVQPLTIGELWAVAITLRIVLIENMRRLADQMTLGREQRDDADAFADRLLTPGKARSALEEDIARRSPEPLGEPFAAQLAKRLRDQDPLTTPALGWLEERLRQQGTTTEEVVQHALLRQGASNLTVRNIVTSMRLISAIDWAEWFESVSLVDERLRNESHFAAMDFPTRNLYRSAIEELARGSSCSELEVTDRALQMAHTASPEGDLQPERVSDPGYHLVTEGRRKFEQHIGFKPPARLHLSRINLRMGMAGYLGEIFVVTLVLLGLSLWALTEAGLNPNTDWRWYLVFGLIAFLPATEVAVTLVNRAVTWSFGALTLPGLELKQGVPSALRTLVVVPTLLTSAEDLREQFERLEVHYLSGGEGDLTYALLTDGLDADQEVMPGDAELLASANAAIDRLNQSYPAGPAGNRFILLHRHRLFNPGENRWMGWERKRGKLTELNRLLRGATDTSFMPINGVPPQPGVNVPADVRYIITLDADTRLPRDTATRLIGKMAHPLNRPIFNAELQRNVGGYAIMQPRVTPSLPLGLTGSLYQRIYSGPAGIDPYAAAVSDVYQDLFGEGSFTGKGIYDLDAFEAALAGRVPDNTLLSHDLFEGIFARAGLASDIEVVEDFPSRYEVAGQRLHRWTRGDWQLLPWLFGLRRTGATAASRAIPGVGRGKMADNLRRSLIAPFTLATLAICWMLPLPVAIAGSLLILAASMIPSLMPIVLSLIPRRDGIRLRSHFANLWQDTGIAAMHILLSLTFLPDQSWRMGDAILRTLVRLVFTRRHLLEWTPYANAQRKPRLDLPGYYRQMAGGTCLALLILAAVYVLAPASWPVALPFLVLWLAAPALAFWVSQPSKPASEEALSDKAVEDLRLTARRTWRFFETFVTPADSLLPPDNFQEDPKPVIARRTSPTNMGLYLLSCIAARDFGWAGTARVAERLDLTLANMEKLPRFKGHFFNWYATEDMRVLEPAYVSSVDSGNLAGHLLVVANACESWLDAPQVPNARQGLLDNLHLAREAFNALPGSINKDPQLTGIFEEMEARLSGDEPLATLAPTLQRLVNAAANANPEPMPQSMPEMTDDCGVKPDLAFWIEALGHALNEHEQDRHLATTTSALNQRLSSIAARARAMAMGMDFAFLINPERKLLSIGYSLADNCLDPSCYDLLASEARLASLFAIAKGDATTKHWFRLGRSATPMGSGSALISWSGSMFEYLMPSLVMRAPKGSLLEQTSQMVVERQRGYGRDLGIPWGVSESAYNARDMEFTYQYSNFGVPGLGLKRGLAENVVIAPYATGLATMVNPVGAHENYQRLASMGALGRFGFYEAIDFTPARLPKDEKMAIVRNFMAHHQGMTIIGIANTLHHGEMRSRFHREPIIQACELLLQERLPRNVAIAHPRAEEVKSSPIETGVTLATTRRISGAQVASYIRPVTHLLSNGRYAVMLTASGAGYSRWRDLAITRWREDPTRDNWGSFIFVRDTQSGNVWAASAQPEATDAEYNAENTRVIFAEDHAEFIRRDGKLTTSMEVLVSGEDDGEVRRISLVNSGRRARELELTSYAELVLTAASSDAAHPAFAKMFIQTEYLEEYGALIATRRPRAEGETQLWAAHFAVVEGESVAIPQYESDRAHFFGRATSSGNEPVGDATAVIAAGRPLSNTIGTVLDPIFSVRRCVRVPAGEVARVAFWTLVASSRADLINLIDKHLDRYAFDRARTLAWTQAQVELRHLDIQAEEAVDFQGLAAPILYADPRFRATSETIIRGAGPQSGLWSQSISGDLPIVLLRIDDIEDIAQVRQLLRAHEYWRIKRLAVDVVIINERASSYVQDLQIAIETAVRSSQSRPRFGAELAQGSAYALRADLMSPETRALIHSVARVTLVAHRGKLGHQLQHQLARQAVQPKPVSKSADGKFSDENAGKNMPWSPVRWQKLVRHQPLALPEPLDTRLLDQLEFFNGLGGFDKDGREYVTVLTAGRRTPAPWINVISNPGFGFQVSAEGSGYTWADNSRENQLTAWSNDPVKDPTGEAIYICDEATGELWSPTAQPIRDGGIYIARHGHGYSRFEHKAQGIASELLQYVALGDPIKISRLKLVNQSSRPRRLSVTSYTEWVLGTARGASGPYLVSELDSVTGALLAQNPWSTAFANRFAFADLGGKQTAWTADRTEFLGTHGGPGWPAALVSHNPLAGTTGAGLDPCAVLQQGFELGVGESIEVVVFTGQCRSLEEARALIIRYRDLDLDQVLNEVTRHWDALLNTVQVKTPDRAMDIMLNGWLLYQTLACRVWARSAFYQASGAYGFRDQLQDGMALTFSRPEFARSHLLRAASRQFVEGDVQHWWLPHSGQGVRTRISDDRVWLAFAAATYITTSGDIAILDEWVTFLEGPQLKEGEHDAFFPPLIAPQSASFFEHCARGLDQCLQLTGELGLPLMGTGDWNDGMNRVAEGGKGESVWLGWLLVRTIELFAPYADVRDPERARRWRVHASAVTSALESKAWDGEWYRRATFDDGSWLGSKDSGECQIDSIAQSWAVLAGTGDPTRAVQAMASVEKYLIRRDEGLALLFTPPFDKTPRDPGYIKGYPPGLRENGGQYSHAAMWLIFAFAKLGQGDKAQQLFALLNPINHARRPEEAERYKVEPYVVAADVYSVAPHSGRGGWTWYTGAAGWMYRAGTQAILGLRREGDTLIVDPCIPPSWPGFEATINLADTTYVIKVVNAVKSPQTQGFATLDDREITYEGKGLSLALDGKKHQLLIAL